MTTAPGGYSLILRVSRGVFHSLRGFLRGSSLFGINTGNRNSIYSSPPGQKQTLVNINKARTLPTHNGSDRSPFKEIGSDFFEHPPRFVLGVSPVVNTTPATLLLGFLTVETNMKPNAPPSLVTGHLKLKSLPPKKSFEDSEQK